MSRFVQSSAMKRNLEEKTEDGDRVSAAYTKYMNSAVLAKLSLMESKSAVKEIQNTQMKKTANANVGKDNINLIAQNMNKRLCQKVTAVHKELNEIEKLKDCMPTFEENGEVEIKTKTITSALEKLDQIAVVNCTNGDFKFDPLVSSVKKSSNVIGSSQFAPNSLLKMKTASNVIEKLKKTSELLNNVHQDTSVLESLKISCDSKITSKSRQIEQVPEDD